MEMGPVQIEMDGRGRSHQEMEVARFARTLGTLLQSGVSILPAFNLVKEISQNLAISRSIAHVQDRLREGKGISRSMEETGSSLLWRSI